MGNKENENIEQEELETQDSSNEESQEVNELEQCQKELAEQKDKFLRAHADFDNMKKRLEKEKTNALIYANEAFAKDLLTVLDTFENALKSVEQVESNDKAINEIKKGMTLTYEQLLSILKKHGVEEVVCKGEFNPEHHQAVTQMDSDEHKSGDIVQVLQKGYKLKDRLLRPSMVATCK